MDVVPVIRILWKRRLFVALGLLGAVAIGLLAGRVLAAQDDVRQAGVGTARVVLDTARSQLVASAPDGAESLSMRASLLANTLATADGRSAVARNAGIDPEDLDIRTPAWIEAPRTETPLVRQLVKMTATLQAPFAVELIVDGVTPIITIRAYAPDDGSARRLAAAAISGLRTLLAEKDGISGGFVVDTVVPPRIEYQPTESTVVVGMIAAALATFIAWCLLIVVAVALRRRWHRLARRDPRSGAPAMGSMPSRLFRRPRRATAAILAASLVVGLLCSAAAVHRISGFPPQVERRDLRAAGAITHVLVDLERSGIADRSAQWSYFNRLSKRADLFAHLVTTDSVLSYVGRRAGVPPDRIAAVSPIAMDVVDALAEPGSEAEARNLVLARKPYRLELQAAQGSPIVDIYAQAPTPAEAQRLARAAIQGAQDYFNAVSARTSLPPQPGDAPVDDPYAVIDEGNRITLTEIGRSRGVDLTAGANMKVAAITFPLSFGAALLGLLGLAALRRSRGTMPPSNQDPVIPGPTATPIRRPILSAAVALPFSVPVLQPGGAVALQASTKTQIFGRSRSTAGDWPRTSRVLPWMLAGFLVVLWLVPFDSIRLDVPSPIDLWLDRLVLPILVGAWGLLLLVGGRWAPRLWPSWIHVAVGAFVVTAFLSVILAADSLNHTLEFDIALKKLPLMLSYPMVFVIFASVVRRSEVAAFLKLTLALAVLCAAGMFWEDHFAHNLFFDWSDKLLPGVFHVADGNAGWDTMGRRYIHGPTAHPLVAAGMLSMAFPIAVLGVIQGRSLRQKLVYGLAGAVLLVGILSTERKTGLVAPAAALATLAYFRRQQLLRLAPLGVLLFLALLIVAPGTVIPVIRQFKLGNLGGADTVNDRASDYDAIRPDIFSHVAFGRGFGTYDPVGHRILDSQILGTVIETGAIGLLAFLLMGVAVVASARHTINARHSSWAPSALAGATAAVVFLVLAFLFDSLAFPHLPYVFMCFAALVAIVVRNPPDARLSSASHSGPSQTA